MSRQKNIDNPVQIENFTRFLNKFITENKLTNKAFGDLIGKDEATIRRYRNGLTLPSHDAMEKILTVTHTRYHNALGFADPENSEDK